MRIAGFLKQTLIDYDKKIAAEVFTSGCNFKCPSCHSKHIINGNGNYNEEDIFSYLSKAKGFIDGFVICGGEPTIYSDLCDFAKKLKNMNLNVKLDTNGSNPSMLKKLLEGKLIDYAAMDVKGTKELYSLLIGIERDYNKEIEESMKILADSGIDYEFRTTIAPVYKNKNKNPGWMSIQDVENIGNWIANATGKNNHRYYLQKFVARGKSEMLDERFSKENLSREMHETPQRLLEEMKDAVKKHLPYCEVR